MTTITRNGVEFTIVYIDPSASSSGTGETYDSPLTDFPLSLDEFNQTCFLIRRTSEDYHTDMRVGDYTGKIYNFMIMGMPKSTDEEWKYLNDSDVKSAWGSDSYDYANVRWNSSSYGDNVSYCFYTKYLQNLFITRAYMYRDSNSSGVGNDLNAMVMVDYGDGKSNVYYNYCKFGVIGTDLDDATWRENNSNIPGENNNDRKLQNYFWGSDIKSFVMNNCIVNTVPYAEYSQYWYYRGKPFYFNGKPIDVEIKNSKIYSTWGANNLNTECYRATNTFYFHYQPRNLKVYNVEFNSVMRNTFNQAYGFIYSERTNSLTENDNNQDSNCISVANIKNIIINYIKMKDALPSGMFEDRRDYSYIFKLYGLNSYDIDNIKVNGNISGCEVCGKPILWMPDCFSFYSGMCKRNIKNIKVDFGTDYRTLKYWNPVTSVSDIYALSISGYRVQPFISRMRYSDETWGNTTTANYPMIENVEINAPFIKSAFNHCNIRNAVFNTKLELGNRVSAEIDYLSNYFPSQIGLSVDQLSYVRIKEYNANLNSPLSTYNGESQISAALGDWFLNGSDIYVDKTNVALIPENSITINYPMVYSNNLICPNYLQTNQYIQLSKNGYMKSWNTVRTGSTSLASIKCNLENGTLTNGVNCYGITLGTRPYKGIQIEPSNTGNQIMKIYIAYKNFTAIDEDNLLDKVFAEVEVPNNGFGTNDFDSSNVYDSRADGYIEDDDSVWSNDTGLTCKVINIPVNVIRTDEPINVRITYEVEGSSKYLYIDPDIKLV